jgi:signal transduction histidine kinase
VSARLARPELLFARQRSRAWRFGSIIGLAVLAVFAGCVTAWRSFRRQLELNVLKTNFVSSVSHELRSPISSVRLMAEELLDSGSNNREKNKRYHKFIVQECRRLSALIENVLDYSRHEQGCKQYAFEPTDLMALTDVTMDLMATYAEERSIVLKKEVCGKVREIDGDGRALQQVLVNLLDNAIKHSPVGGIVEVGLLFGDRDVALVVRDHGEGIPEEDHKRIFERFYRRGSELRRETQGVGLGLAIVKYVVAAHLGTISVQSKVGEGSCFMVSLPLEQEREGEV